ncbi:MAG: B12-binding domain-containing radical SAM protein [Deltaproteobacteria bacterium]|nr:B12-binding domain-containing radical SAM protein [Deltaproteobacteria bacterium]
MCQPQRYYDAVLIQLDFSSKSSIYFPTGLVAIATELKKFGYRVNIVDFNLQRISFNKDALATLSELEPTKTGIVGISVYYGLLLQALRTARLLKNLLPDTKIVLGGPGVFKIELSILERFSNLIDYVVTGEGETPFRSILDLHTTGISQQLPHCHYFDSKRKIISGSVNSDCEQTRCLPVLDYTLINMNLYLQHQESIELPIIAGYGCPHSCSFCSTNQFWNRKYRTKSTSQLIKEMQQNHEQFGVNHFSLIHDNLFVSNEVIEDFVMGFSKNPYYWSSTIRLDRITPDLPLKLSKIGCKSLAIGIETASADLQRKIKKNISLEHIVTMVDLLQKEGIHLTLSYILDLPGSVNKDNEETLSLAFLLASRFFNIQTQINRMVFLNGSKIYDQRRGYHYFTSVNIMPLIKFCAKTIPKTVSYLSLLADVSVIQIIEDIFRDLPKMNSWSDLECSSKVLRLLSLKNKNAAHLMEFELLSMGNGLYELPCGFKVIQLPLAFMPDKVKKQTKTNGIIGRYILFSSKRNLRLYPVGYVGYKVLGFLIYAVHLCVSQKIMCKARGGA